MLSALLVPLLSLAIASPAPQDLAKRYPGKLTWVEQGLTWSCGAEDVWQLKAFELRFGKDFELSCGKASVGLGVHEGNVLWAVVFPEQPVTVRAKGQPGDGEQAISILLRFAPGEVGRVFPSKNVVGPGDPWLRARADRVFRNKIDGQRWSTPAGNPTVVQPGFTLVDLEGPVRPTTGSEPAASGKRRFYEIDGGANKLTYLPEFEEKQLPPEQPIAPKESTEVFDEVWEAFDREYANFVLLPKLDWKKTGDLARKSLPRVRTTFDLGAVLADMLASLEDLHVW